ncbi:MAG: hypothetical protein GXP62_11010 [Oligoflexia bacterium]|nr:hypothetical protein [Oligoflexia bacterium]
MLAGKLKLKHFTALALAGMALLALSLVSYLLVMAPKPAPPVVATVRPPRVAQPAAPPAAPPAPSPTAAVPVSTAADASRPQDADVMRWVGKDLGTKKKKDVTSGKPWKVNVYQDAGKSSANRAKVDLDRDNNWDEKWTFDDNGGVSRKVAPLDDEQYTQTWIWTGDAWTQSS